MRGRAGDKGKKLRKGVRKQQAIISCTRVCKHARLPSGRPPPPPPAPPSPGAPAHRLPFLGYQPRALAQPAHDVLGALEHLVQAGKSDLRGGVEAGPGAGADNPSRQRSDF